MAGRGLFWITQACSHVRQTASVPTAASSLPTSSWARASPSRFLSTTLRGENSHDPDVASSEPSDVSTTTPSSSTTQLNRPPLPGSIKKLNRLLGLQELGEIPEHELKEQFVRGSGPGGQAINKTSSSVSLIHLPTGVRVQAQPTRSREANRKAARRILAEKLDMMIATGSWSRESGGLSNIPAAASGAPVEEQAEGKSRKEMRKVEEVEMAEKWSRQEIIWEKERRRKANRAKKSKRKKQEGEGD